MLRFGHVLTRQVIYNACLFLIWLELIPFFFFLCDVIFCRCLTMAGFLQRKRLDLSIPLWIDLLFNKILCKVNCFLSFFRKLVVDMLMCV
jgi:hypothetical protein